MNRQHTPDDSALKPTVRALNQLSPQSQETIISLVGQLAQREGIRGFRGARFSTWLSAE